MECLLFHGKTFNQTTLQKTKIFFYYLRFHRSFIEASQEYYYSMFEPSAKKDELLMNVIDYFTKKWNKVKSDGLSSEMKKFKYLKKTLNGFAKEKDQKEFEYLDYRNTKTQKVRKDFVDNEKIIYNKRKLSEFVNLIRMLHGDENKVKLLKEHVYLNYEFMTSKAEFREMSFVVSMHETILKLGDKELIDISQIYVDQFPFIERESKTLIFNILSRLESRNDNVSKFAAPKNLLLLHSYKNEDIERELFILGEYERIKYCWIIKDTYLIIMNNYYGYQDNIHLINSKTKQHFGKIVLNNEDDCEIDDKRIEIVINNNYKSLDDLNNIFQLNGIVYLAEGKTFYSTNFQNEILIIHKFDEEIYQLFILNANIFAFRFKKKIALLNINNKTSIQQEIEFPTSDFFLGSTKHKRFVHSDSNMPGTNLKIITYDKQKTKNSIKIFQFNNDNQELELFCEFEILFDISFQSDKSFVIDESYLIDNIKSPNHQNEMIRFAIITTEDVLKVIEAKKKNEYSIVGEIKEAFSLFENVELDFLFGNILIVKMYKTVENEIRNGVACIYDIGKYH
jgi:hypothetical protein